MTDETKRCPFCGEEILAIAKKCKHCGSSPEQGGATVPPMSAKPLPDFGLFLLALPVIATVLIWVWVGSMSLLQGPLDTLGTIALLTILATAAIASIETAKARRLAPSTPGTYGPTAWFFIFVLLWIVGYPVYLFKRKHLGLPNRLAAGLPIALIFLGSLSYMTVLIEDKKAEIRGQFEQMFGEQTPAKPVPRPQPTTDSGDSEKFTRQCHAHMKDNAMKLGGMSAGEADAHAKEACSEYLPSFKSCMKEPGASFEPCTWVAIPTGD